MAWTTGALVMLGSIVLGLQGRSLLSDADRSPRFRPLGWMSLVSAALLLLATFLFAGGTLVLSPGLGVIFGQGTPGGAGVTILVVGSAIVAALGAGAAMVGRGRAGWLPWILSLAAVVGILAASRTGTFGPATGITAGSGTLLLDAAAPRALAVYTYDLWFPPLMLWIGVCLMECALKVCRVDSVKTRLYVNASLAAALALWAKYRAERLFVFADPWSGPLWGAILWLSIPVFVVCASLIAGDLLLRETPLNRRISRLAVPAAITVIVLVSGVAWLPLFFVAALLIVTLALLSIQFWNSWRAGTIRIPDLGRPGRLDDVPILLSFSCIVFCFLDLFYFARFGPVVDLAGLILACVLLLELLGGAPLRWLAEPAADDTGEGIGSPLVRGWRTLRGPMKTAMNAIGRMVSAIVRVDTWPRVVAKGILGVLVLVVLSEIPHATKTVVYPFLVPPATESEYHGKMIAERLVNMLGVLREELNPYVITVTDSGKTSRAFAAPFVAGPDAAPGPETMLGGATADFSIGGVKIPLGAIARPLARPVRALLGVTEINGVYSTQSDEPFLFATSTDGRSWRVSGGAPGPEPRSTICAVASLNPDGGEHAMIDEMAFRIFTQSPGMAALGMTSSWKAFQVFHDGRKAWQRFESGEPDGLIDAIDRFRCATQIDPSFVLAYYWLGLAYRADGQPHRAVETFRAAIRARSDYAAAYIALADTLYSFTGYYSSSAAVSPPVASAEFRKTYRREALAQWYQVLQLPPAVVSTRHRAAAYSGLCRQALDANHGAGDNYLAYFRCAQSAALLGTLPASLRDAPDVRSKRATAFNNMGVALERTSMKLHDADPKQWSCSVGQIYESPYAHAAAPYFARAVALDPADRQIRCNAVGNSLARGHRAAMDDLKQERGARAAAGDRLLDRAESAVGSDNAAASRYFRSAIDEYAAALEADPMDLFTLNSYAYTFWRWRLSSLSSSLPAGPDAALAHSAEANARLAVRLATNTVARNIEASVRDTLGEVLLAQGRAEEAVEVLEEIKRRDLLPLHVSVDEIRWDLVHAYRCAARTAERSQADVYLTESRKQVKQIELNERDRERLTYYGAALLDENRTVQTCESSIERSPDPGHLVYTIPMRPTYSKYPGCNWMGVAASIENAAGGRTPPLELHVWGGGIDERVPVFGVEFERDYVWLASEPRATRRYYFAQLESPQAEAGAGSAADNPRAVVSRVYPIETMKDCGRNLIQLTFSPGGSTRR